MSEVVDVDYRLWGCPVSLPEFEAVFKAALSDQPYRQPNEPVCVECKRNDILCGHDDAQMAHMASRICGICAVSHRCAAVQAAEAAFCPAGLRSVHLLFHPCHQEDHVLVGEIDRRQSRALGRAFAFLGMQSDLVLQALGQTSYSLNPIWLSRDTPLK